MKFLIIEDDQAIIENVTLILQMGWPTIEIIPARLASRGLQLIEIKKPDLVILDLGLPDMSGFDTLKQIRLFSRIPVLILTVRGDEKDVVQGLALGADDYIVKPFRQMELLARVKALLRRTSVPEEDIGIRVGHLRFGRSITELLSDGHRVQLTVTEGKIIHHLMQKAGQVVTYKSLAETLWGEEYPGARQSLKVYVNHLRKKLELIGGQQAIIQNEAGIGYILVTDSPSLH
ncbi:response regulator transcription factor [Dehalogenimonas sp. 4OHTPN]|uniref:Response regulator transcription factor n=1 Tax=Dehalogenimonas sp. 4OHTPN TaxID=3166643 RepID=A0AAU8GAI8_9CHLR